VVLPMDYDPGVDTRIRGDAATRRPDGAEGHGDEGLR
jgi:hypothetical protein